MNLTRTPAPGFALALAIGGAYDQAVIACRGYCDEVGMCVTVTPTKYVYTDGETAGVAVGFINYGRFPSDPETIFGHARTLAHRLIFALGQDSASIVASDRTLWISKRPEDGAPSTQASAIGKAE